MFAMNVLWTSVLVLAGLWLSYHWYQVRKQKKINQIISREVEELYDAVQEQLKKNTSLLEKAKATMRVTSSGTADDHLASPEMLASVITVIIGKCGNMRLGMEDFLAVKDTDYVSVYVDTLTNDLILSLDHGLGRDTETSAMSFGSLPDDDTYH